MILGNQCRGYRLGSGVIDLAHQRFIVNVPKNASSFILDWTSRSGKWHAHSLTDVQNHPSIQEIIVILRDPVERWLSGFTQYACSWLLNASRFFDTVTGPGPEFQRKTGREFVENYNWLTERLMFDNLETFDDHVWPQHWFFETLLPDIPRRYFYIDNGFNQRLQTHLGLCDPDPDLDRNAGADNQDMLVIQQFLAQRMAAVPELLSAVKTAYAGDYKIIESMKCR